MLYHREIDRFMRYRATNLIPEPSQLRLNRFDWGTEVIYLASFFDGHGRHAAQSGIFARQFLVAESAVNLL